MLMAGNQNLTFVKYIYGEYIEFYGETVDKEPVYDKHGELMDYNYSAKSMVRRYRRDKFSGEYFEY